MALDPHNTDPNGAALPAPGASPAADPSMDDILASIRRILDEEGTRAGTVPTPVVAPPRPEDRPPVTELPADDLPAPPPDILELNTAMMLPDLDATTPGPIPVPLPMSSMATPILVPPNVPETPALDTPMPTSPSLSNLPAVVLPDPLGDTTGLVAPAAAAAASASVGALMRTLATERGTAVSRGGPTIEDLVREEMRPLLKEWLDTHLPPIVERLVRAEIERVVARTG